jgi:hypothetical protein
MIVIFFRAIKRAELAINVADVGVIDVAIDDVGHDFISVAVVGRTLRLSSPLIGQRSQLLQRPLI